MAPIWSFNLEVLNAHVLRLTTDFFACNLVSQWKKSRACKYNIGPLYEWIHISGGILHGNGTTGQIPQGCFL